MNIRPIKQQFLLFQILAQLEDTLESIQFVALLSDKDSIAFNPIDVDEFKKFMFDNLDIDYTQWRDLFTDKERIFGCTYILSISHDDLTTFQKNALSEYRQYLRKIIKKTL